MGVDLAQPLHHLVAGILLGQAAADDHDIGRRQFREGGRCDQLAAACVVDDRHRGADVLGRARAHHYELA